MNGAMVVGAVSLGVVVALCATYVVLAPRLGAPRWLRRVAGRVDPVVAVSSRQLGRPVTGLIVLLAGGGATVAVLWPLGWPVKIFESRVDHPLFAWFQDRQDAGWTKIWRALTNVGSLDLTQAVTVVAAVGLALLYAKRRWWVPLTIMPIAYGLEKTLQDLLTLVVDRGHPPTTMGTYPSGGCARVIIVYGLIAFFLLRRFDAGPRLVAVGMSLVAMAETVQAYARIYNLEHWFTDVVAGILFGLLVISTCIGAALVLDRADGDTASSVATPRRDAATGRVRV